MAAALWFGSSSFLHRSTFAAAVSGPLPTPAQTAPWVHSFALRFVTAMHVLALELRRTMPITQLCWVFGFVPVQFFLLRGSMVLRAAVVRTQVLHERSLIPRFFSD